MNLKAAQRRIDNVESLLQSLQTYQQSAIPAVPRSSSFCASSVLDSGDDEEEREAGNTVTLTTSARSQGARISGGISGRLGKKNSYRTARTLMPTSADVADPEHASDVSEERRLAYVGITRAKSKLYISRSAARVIRGKAVARTMSRFLQEIPESLLESRDLAAEMEAPVESEEVSAFFSQFAAQLGD